MKFISSKSLLVSFLVLCGVPTTTAQTSPQQTLPNRGTTTIAAYSESDLASVNTQNGNLTVRMPMASLPPGRAGFRAGLDLIYNSSIYDLSVGIETWDNAGTPQNRLTSRLQPSNSGGGWQYSYSYGVLIDPNNLKSCSSSINVVKIYALLPDGSQHTLRLAGYTDDNADGFYAYNPNGTRACQTNQSGYPATLSGNLTYYTSDGTYIRLVIPTSTGSWTDNQWTMYFPDGKTVTGYGPQATTVADRNGNFIRITNLDNGTEPQTLLEDQFYRSIVLQRQIGGSPYMQDSITQTGAGGSPITWQVNWDVSLASTGLQYQCTAEGDSCSTVTSGGTLGTIAVTSVTQNFGSAYNYRGSPSYATTSLNYAFVYAGQAVNGWGELSQITLPQGRSGQSAATVTLAYQQTGTFKGYADLLYNPVISKTRAWQDENDGTVTAVTPEVWTYSYTTPRVITAPDGGQTKYTYFNTSLKLQQLAYKIEFPDRSVIERIWAENQPPYADISTSLYATWNPYVNYEILSVAQATGPPIKSAVTKFAIDHNGNQTSKIEYDWSQSYTALTTSMTAPPPSSIGTQIRATSQLYVSQSKTAGDTSADANAYWNPTGPKILNLLGRRAVSADAGAAVPVSFDEYSYDTNGNNTAERHWDSQLGAAPSYSAGYPLTNTSTLRSTVRNFDAYGNVTLVTDPESNKTQFVFDPDSLYVTLKTLGYGSTVARRFSYINDPRSGLVTSETDVDNGIVKTTSYDPLGRPVYAVEGNGTRATSTQYEDLKRRVIVSSDLNTLNDGLLVNITEFDQLNRVNLTRQLEDATTQDIDNSTQGIKVQYRYRTSSSAGKSYRLVSTPYRAATTSTATGENLGWTLTTIDNAGRPESSETFSGTSPPAPFGSGVVSTGKSTTEYSAEMTTAKDQGCQGTSPAAQPCISRTTTADGLGRSAKVTEAGSTDTLYEYDVLNNLTKVTQGTQIRTFIYYSTSLLKSAVNPESGTTAYTYDGNGSLATKTFPGSSNNVVQYSYDELGRMKTAYTVAEGFTTYGYDQGTFGKGLLSSISYGPATTTSTAYSGHDAFGRVTALNQKVNSSNYAITYTYNLAGQMTSMTYPSGRIVSFGYDKAGRTNQVANGSLSGGNNYASSYTYSAPGFRTSVKLGNGLWQSADFNSRLQPLSVYLGVTQGASDLWSLQNTYHATQNNGSVLQQAIRPSASVLISQSFGYDSVGRLTVAAEQPSNATSPVCPDSGSRWCEGYGYDRWGNRSIAATMGVPISPLTPVSYDAATNRITNPAYSYDVNGRGVITKDSLNATYLYDTEGRMIASCQNDPSGCVNAAGTGRMRYRYDGFGRRVRKIYPDDKGSTYVYGVDGALVGEYSDEGQNTPVGTYYVTADPLGSVRVLSAGTVVQRRDYRPFGDQIIPASGDPRLGVAGYTTDTGVSQQFTGKERDSETGLDWFESRYFSGAQGRFTSPDAPFGDQHASDPQSWNLYTYSRNNPLRYNDPTGRKCVQTSNGQADDGTGGGCEPAGVDAKGNIAAQQFTVTESGLLLTQQKGIIYSLGENGSRTPVAEQGLQDASLELLPAIGLGRAALGALEGAGARGLAGSIRNVNPTGGTLNCVNCAIATDATLAGRAASALPGGATSVAVLEQQFGGQFVKVSGQQAIESTMQAAGSGARAIVYGERAGGIGHVFNVVNQNGVVRFLDGQTGRIASFAGYTGFRLLRTN